MNVEVFENIIFTEYKSKKFLKKYCWKNGHVFCTRCHGYKIYRTAEKRYRCKRCGYTFHDFTGRWINNLNISLKQWLWILKFFELDLSTRKISEQIDLSYPTVLKACNIIRAAIAMQEGETPLTHVHEAGPEREIQSLDMEKMGSLAVFGIREKEGKVNIEIIPGMTPEALLELDVRKVREGSVVYTDRYGDYDALIFSGYNEIKGEQKKRFTSGKVHISGVGGFWAFARERWGKFRGISKEYFPFYLKELEFRYNYRNQPIYEILVKNVCQMVPNNL